MGALKAQKTKNYKEDSVKKLTEKIKNSKTLMVVSIAGVPSKQFQEIKKTIREHAEVIVAKKNIYLRTLKNYKKESIAQLEQYLDGNLAFAFSHIDGFELAGILNQKKTPIFAKAGQIAPEDIEIKEGPTNLPPGPAISEFGTLGIQIAVEDGKIAIKQPKVVVKKGQEIRENVASMLQKLNIQPFKIGLEPKIVYDIETEKIYKEIKIDSEEAKQQLKEASAKALGFAQKIAYYCKETIGYLLAKANMEAEHLSKLEKKEPNNEKTEENTQLNKPEEKA